MIVPREHANVGFELTWARESGPLRLFPLKTHKTRIERGQVPLFEPHAE